MGDEGYQALAVDVIDGVATITIDNGPVNLFDHLLYPEMVRLSAELADDDDVRVVVLQSANPEFFIAHFDVSLIQHIPAGLPAPTELNDFHRMCEAFRTMPKATIAVIEGRVGGGGSELALSCDMRFASPTAVFNQPEVALGILPGGSGTVRLPRLIGRSRALEVILGCDDIDAATAERWGWVNRVVPDGQLRPFVSRLAQRIAGFPKHAVAAAKVSVLSAEGDIEPDLLAEAGRFNATLGDSATRRALQSFLDLGGQTRDGELRLGDLAGDL
jgi:enoyl-CoA hydratase/carnithine racemase